MNRTYDLCEEVTLYCEIALPLKRKAYSPRCRSHVNPSVLSGFFEKYFLFTFASYHHLTQGYVFFATVLTSHRGVNFGFLVSLRVF